MDKVRLGFVGVGYMGQNAHLKNYAALPDCEIVAIAEPRQQTAELVARRYGVPHVYRDHREMLAHEKLDALVAAQPYRAHAALLPELYASGLPLFTEKPLALSVETGERLAALAKRHGVKHMVGYHKRSDPAMEYARDLVSRWKAGGEFGQMRLVRITMPPGNWVGGADMALSAGDSAAGAQAEGDAPYFDSAAARQYDTFVNYYIHQINAMRFLLGEPYEVTYAEDTQVLLAARSASGVAGVIEMEPWANSVDWMESCLVGFQKGFIRVDLPAPLASQSCGRVTVMEDRGGTPITWSPSLPPVHAMRNQAKNFLAMVRGEKEAPCYADEAAQDLAMATQYIRLLNR